MIRMGQLRAVQRAAYFKPQGRRRIFILDGADTMRWNDADLFLKILEEPPESATLILLAPTPDSLLPDDPLALPAIPFRAGAGRTDRTFPERAHRSAKPAERKLAAQLVRRQSGRGLELDPRRIRAPPPRASSACWTKLSNGGKYGEIFAATAQLAKQEKESFENILALFYSLLTDLLEFSQGPKSSLPRNPDLRRNWKPRVRKSIWSGSCGLPRPGQPRKPAEAEYRPAVGSGCASSLPSSTSLSRFRHDLIFL